MPTSFSVLLPGVSPAHRGKGIAHLLMKAALIVAKEQHCGMVIIFASSDGTRKVCEAAGFELMLERQWDEWRRPNGSPFFVDIKSKKATAHFLMIQ